MHPLLAVGGRPLNPNRRRNCWRDVVLISNFKWREKAGIIFEFSGDGVIGVRPDRRFLLPCSKAMMSSPIFVMAIASKMGPRITLDWTPGRKLRKNIGAVRPPAA